jgi:hypothetical protein
VSYWPAGMKTAPIGQWPGHLTTKHQRAPFSATLGSTMEILNREIRALSGSNVLIQIAVPASKFRLDGMPYADAKPEHPGLILTLDSKHGALSYPCDTFSTWQDNLRAIALALEALRKVDRYGVTKGGQQYRGFLAIEGAAAGPFDFTALIHDAGWTTSVVDLTLQLRQAKRLTHPDMDGDADTFQRVMLAERYLTENGQI